MDWVKLTTNYYFDAAIMRAGEAAEVLFTRALAYCGDQENGGLVPREAVARLTPTRGVARARALVREGIWVEVPEGWRFVQWDKHQTPADQLERARESNRKRQAQLRERRNADRNGVTNGAVTVLEESREEKKAAAAAAADVSHDLPPAVEILRSRLDAAKLTVRWDCFNGDDLAEIETLIDTHGDQALVKDALRAFQPNSPAVYASAWLGGWRQLRTPGRLELVVDDPCPAAGHSGTTKHCIQCASEKIASDR